MSPCASFPGCNDVSALRSKLKPVDERHHVQVRGDLLARVEERGEEVYINMTDSKHIQKHERKLTKELRRVYYLGA